MIASKQLEIYSPFQIFHGIFLIRKKSSSSSMETFGLKAAAGMTIVQEPETAQFCGMPFNTITARAADYIIPPKKYRNRMRTTFI